MRRRQVFAEKDKAREHATKIYHATGDFIESSPPDTCMCLKCGKVFKRGLTMHTRFCKGKYGNPR